MIVTIPPIEVSTRCRHTQNLRGEQVQDSARKGCEVVPASAGKGRVETQGRLASRMPSGRSHPPKSVSVRAVPPADTRWKGSSMTCKHVGPFYLDRDPGRRVLVLPPAGGAARCRA